MSGTKHAPPTDATMAAAHLAIAKAALAAALLRGDPQPCSRDEIDELTRSLSLAATRCTPAHVQVWP